MYLPARSLREAGVFLVAAGVFAAATVVGCDAVHAAPFADVPLCCWDYEAISELADMGIVVGDHNGHFRRTALLTRAEAAALGFRLFESWRKATGLVPAAPKPFPRFVDVPKDHWAKRAVDQLTAEGIIQGYPLAVDVPQRHWAFQAIHYLTDARVFPPLRRFRPSQPLSRRNAIRWLVRCVGFDLAGGGAQAKDLYFTDGHGIRLPYRQVVEGFPDGELRLNKPMSRSETVMFLARFIAAVRKVRQENDPVSSAPSPTAKG